MKKLLIIVTILTATTSFAQTDLHVSSNASTFIYVDGNGFNDATAGVAPLYVTNDINLAGANSYIYLRNEAQILQGTVTTNNSGTGQLSVYQRGTVSNFNYNYWCSPVGNTTTDNSLNRNFVPNNNLYGRDLTSGTPEIASNLATFTTGYDGSANPFFISSRWLYTYGPGGTYSDWDILGASGTSALPGYGFTMKGVTGTNGANNTGNNQLYDFRGKPNTGEIFVPVLAPVAGVIQNTLTGNPYPSALDARDFFHLDSENQAAIGTSGLLFWEQFSTSHTLSDYVGGYGLYTISTSGVVSYTAAPFQTYDGAGNPIGGVFGPSPNNTPGVNAPGRYLPIGQGFMVEGAIDGNMVFRNTYRQFWKETSGDSHFFRNASDSDTEEMQIEDTSNLIPDNFMRFRVVFDIQHNSQFFSRELLVNMVDDATDGFDFGLEAKLPEVMPSDAYIPFNETTAFGIFAVPFSMERIIPLTAIVNNQQNVRFRAYELQNFSEDIPVYLHDIENNVYVDLRTQPYEINLEAGTYTDRFEITFTQDDVLDTPDVTAADFKILQNNTQAQLTIFNPNGLHVKSVQMFDTAGKQIFDARNLSVEDEYIFSTKTLSDGIYVATITLDTTKTISKKVVVKN